MTSSLDLGLGVATKSFRRFFFRAPSDGSGPRSRPIPLIFGFRSCIVPNSAGPSGSSLTSTVGLRT